MWGVKKGREKGDRYRAKRTLWLWNVIAGNKVPLESIVHSGKERGGWGASLRDAQQFRSRRYRDIKSDIFFVPAYITSIRDCLDVPVQIETVDRRDKAQESSRYRAIFVCISCFFLVLYAIYAMNLILEDRFEFNSRDSINFLSSNLWRNVDFSPKLRFSVKIDPLKLYNQRLLFVQQFRREFRDVSSCVNENFWWIRD